MPIEETHKIQNNINDIRIKPKEKNLSFKTTVADVIYLEIQYFCDTIKAL